MTDEPLTPPAELASAAFDGETTAAERALVDASTALGDELSFYGEMRDRLADVEVPAVARESAVAAALAAFDQIQALGGDGDASDEQSGSDEQWTDATSASTSASTASAPPPTPRLAPVVSLQQRRSRQLRWLGGAAAAAVVAVFAVGVANIGGGSDEKSSSATEAQYSDQADTAAEKSTPTPPQLASEPASEMATAETTAAADSTMAAAGGDMTEDAGGGPSTLGDPAALLAQASGTRLDTDDAVRAFVTSSTFDDQAESSSSDSDTASPTEQPTAGSTAETTAESVATVAESTADTTAATSAAPVTQSSTRVGPFAGGRACVRDTPDPSAPAFYMGIPVFVVLSPTGNRASIIDADTCAVITVIDL